MSMMHGWTTWDPSSITVWEHLPSGIRCQLVLQNAQGQPMTPSGWEPLEESLPDAAGRSLAHLRVFAGAAEVEVVCGGEGDMGACRIVQVLGDDVSAHWEVNGTLDGWQVRRGTDDVIFAPDALALPEDTASFLVEEREAVLNTRPQGRWQLTEPLAAMEAILAANTMTLPGTDTVATISRFELEQSGAWRLPNCQTFLIALATAYIDPALAVANCKNALRLLAADGILAAERTATGVSRNISNPPVAAFCIWKIFQLTGDRSLLDEAYPLLLRWHDWWLNARDGNQNRLLNWASIQETGMPGHPLYESAPADDKTGILRIDDVGLCSLWALDAYALMRMALQRDDLDQATHLEAEINEISSHANLLLWDSTQNGYCSRDWDGYFTDRESATVLLTLAGSIATRARSDRVVQHFDREYDAAFLVPTVGKDDPAFAEQLPWRGRVSPLLNYLICEGLRQFGFDELAETISLSTLEMMTKSWNDHHQVFGSYHAMSGLGTDIPQDPLAPEGLLMGALGIAMLIDAEAWDGVRVGNLRGVDMAIHGFPLRGGSCDVSSGPWGVSVSRNGNTWFDLDRPAILRNLSQTGHEISCSLKVPGGGAIRLRFYGYTAGDRIVVKVNGNATPTQVNAAGIVEVTVDVGKSHGGHGVWNRAA